MGQINHPRNFCSSASSGGGRRARVCSRQRRLLPSSKPSRLSTRERKKVLRFTYRARTAVAPKLYPGYAVSCKYSQTALQTGPAKGARDGIEWIVSTQLGPRAIHRCARVRVDDYSLFLCLCLAL
jgi:hypothetical protein